MTEGNADTVRDEVLRYARAHLRRSDEGLNYATDFPDRCSSWLKPERRKEFLD